MTFLSASIMTKISPERYGVLQLCGVDTRMGGVVKIDGTLLGKTAESRGILGNG